MGYVYRFIGHTVFVCCGLKFSICEGKIGNFLKHFSHVLQITSDEIWSHNYCVVSWNVILISIEYPLSVCHGLEFCVMLGYHYWGLYHFTIKTIVIMFVFADKCI